MTIAEINAYVSFRAGTDTTNYTAANRLISTNRWLHKIWTMLLESRDGWDIDDSAQTDYPIATTPLVAGQRDYVFPASLKILGIKRVDVTYDGTTYYKCTPLDVGELEYGVGNDTNLDNNFSTGAPVYDMRSNAIFLYPLPTAAQVSAGAKLRIEFTREPLEFSSGDVTTGTKEPPIDEPFHMMIALGMIYDWCSAKGGSSKNLSSLKVDIEKELLDYETRLRRHYNIKDEDTRISLSAAYVNYN
jgi:hypothetical protein